MKRYVIASLGGLIFLHHIICTLLYNAPVNPLTNAYQPYVAGYMNPLFTQKWLLFAPEPATNDLKLWYKIKSENKWSSWYDPLEPILKKHQKIRFTYNAKLLYVYGNIPRDLGIKNEELMIKYACGKNDTSCNRMKNDSLFQSREFILAKRYVRKDVMQSSPVAKIDSIQIMIIQLYPKQFSERLSNKPFGYANATEFAPISFNNK